MTELETLAKRFKVSQPVFKITTADSGQALIFNTKDPYDCRSELTDDPIEELLANRYAENLNMREAKFEPYVDVQGAYRCIIQAFINFSIHSCKQKNPKQSKLYKWLNNIDPYRDNSQLSDGFVTLYRYAARNNQLGTIDGNDPHAINVLAILELMREKYEQK